MKKHVIRLFLLLFVSITAISSPIFTAPHPTHAEDDPYSIEIATSITDTPLCMPVKKGQLAPTGCREARCTINQSAKVPCQFVEGAPEQARLKLHINKDGTYDRSGAFYPCFDITATSIFVIKEGESKKKLHRITSLDVYAGGPDENLVNPKIKPVKSDGLDVMAYINDSPAKHTNSNFPDEGNPWYTSSNNNQFYFPVPDPSPLYYRDPAVVNAEFCYPFTHHSGPRKVMVKAFYGGNNSVSADPTQVSWKDNFTRVVPSNELTFSFDGNGEITELNGQAFSAPHAEVPRDAENVAFTNEELQQLAFGDQQFPDPSTQYVADNGDGTNDVVASMTDCTDGMMPCDG